ncbi:unnamed protein product [Amoebophrya sp. A120]|nr:unnamed protein product [Amoebophrya sp. A120]|eukprot:GSA120T00016554001.1
MYRAKLEINSSDPTRGRIEVQHQHVNAGHLIQKTTMPDKQAASKKPEKVNSESLKQSIAQWRAELKAKESNVEQRVTTLDLIDLSGQEIGTAGFDALMAFLREFDLGFSILKVYKNHLGNEAVKALAVYLKAQRRPVHEIHLSDNYITEEGIRILLRSIGSLPRYPAVNMKTTANGSLELHLQSLYVRVDSNMIKQKTITDPAFHDELRTIRNQTQSNWSVKTSRRGEAKSGKKANVFECVEDKNVSLGLDKRKYRLQDIGFVGREPFSYPTLLEALPQEIPMVILFKLGMQWDRSSVNPSSIPAGVHEPRTLMLLPQQVGSTSSGAGGGPLTNVFSPAQHEKGAIAGPGAAASSSAAPSNAPWAAGADSKLSNGSSSSSVAEPPGGKKMTDLERAEQLLGPEKLDLPISLKQHMRKRIFAAQTVGRLDIDPEERKIEEIRPPGGCAFPEPVVRTVFAPRGNGATSSSAGSSSGGGNRVNGTTTEATLPASIAATSPHVPAVTSRTPTSRQAPLSNGVGTSTTTAWPAAAATNASQGREIRANSQASAPSSQAPTSRASRAELTAPHPDATTLGETLLDQLLDAGDSPEDQNAGAGTVSPPDESPATDVDVTPDMAQPNQSPPILPAKWVAEGGNMPDELLFTFIQCLQTDLQGYFREAHSASTFAPPPDNFIREAVLYFGPEKHEEILDYVRHCVEDLKSDLSRFL